MERPIVTINQGQLQGTTLTSVFGQNYLAFRGIPFAAPPIGPLRFKEPQPPKTWSGIRDASDYVGTPCIQHRNDLSREIKGSEDCLYLNIYTNSLGHKRPVMFFIHGGSFVESTTNRDVYGPDYLITQDIVLVCVNYRLGPIGFLSLAHEEAPCNLGLRDIIFALKWVKENIEAFGGDPNNVTVFGSSAGSVICHLLTLIPKAKGLVHKAILQSGPSLLIQSLVSKWDVKSGFRLANLLGMHSNDPVKVLEYLRTVPAEKFVECEDDILTEEEKLLFEMRPYEPVVDADYTSDPIIPATIPEMMENDDGSIPIIIGHTPDETLLNFVGNFNERTYKFYDENIDEIIKYKLIEPSILPEMMKDIREFYLQKKPINKENEWNLIRLTSDFFINSNRRIVDARIKKNKSPTYLYNFSYLGDQPTMYQTDHGPQPLKGVAHGDELSYIFYLAYMPMRKFENNKVFPQEGTTDRIVMERLVRMWYNFAATGDPTPKIDDKIITTVWKPSSKENLYYLDINENLTSCDDKKSKSRQFYEKYCKYFK